MPNPGEQEPEVVLDLGHRAHGRAGLWERAFWSIEIAGESPSMKSTSGFCMRPRNWRA